MFYNLGKEHAKKSGENQNGKTNSNKMETDKREKIGEPGEYNLTFPPPIQLREENSRKEKKGKEKRREKGKRKVKKGGKGIKNSIKRKRNIVILLY